MLQTETALAGHPLPAASETSSGAQPFRADTHQELIAYYTEAGPDYAAWSRDWNMHFGYFTRGMRLLDREAMLSRMNTELFARLALPDARRILDAGCGLGTPARDAARFFPAARITGLSLVPWQIDRARELTTRLRPELENRVHFVRGDYTRMEFPDASFDAVYALESACYAPGADKGALLAEIARVLRPGGRVAVADGFLLRDRLPAPLAAITRRICDCWELDTFAELEPLKRRLTQLGFRDIRVEDISWNIAPSVFSVPVVTLRFLFRELVLKRQGLSPKRRNNIVAPLLAPLLGIARRYFAYCFVTATRE